MATATQPHVTTPDDVLQAASRLTPTIIERADEVERARRLPPDLLAELIAAGCFRILLPTSHGGVGARVSSAMRVVETLTRADGAVGWTVMIGAAGWIDLAALPRETFDGLYANGPDVMIAGAFSPSGVAVPVDGGYRISGRWGFASGSPHADWLYGNCVEPADGEPSLRIALFAADQVEIEDTWHVLGLRGTGSHHFRVDNVVVARDRTCALFHDEHWMDEPVARVPPPSLFALHVAAAGIGIARGALDDITEQAATKVPLLSGAALAASPAFHRDLAAADTGLRAAAALLYQVADEAWAAAVDGAPFSWDLRARIRAAATSAVDQAADVVTAAYRAGGGSTLYLANPLQRRLRDIHTLTQHFLVRPDTLVTAGAVLAGQDVDVPVF